MEYFTMFFNHIYLINLKKRSDRLEAVTKQLQSMDINFERVEAIDGDDIKFISDKSIHAWIMLCHGRSGRSSLPA